MRRITFEELQNWLHQAETNQKRTAWVNGMGDLWHILLALSFGYIVYAMIFPDILAMVGAVLFYFFCGKRISRFASIPFFLIFLWLFVKKPESCDLKTKH